MNHTSLTERLQELASEAHQHCKNTQEREFRLAGACHENVIGAADYIRLNTGYNPIIVWGVVSHQDERDTADSISDVSEVKTHFWTKLENPNCSIEDGVDNELVRGIIDVYTNNPLVGDNSSYVESGIPYGGPQPECYNTVEMFRYYGQLSAYDLCSRDNFRHALKTGAIERLDQQT